MLHGFVIKLEETQAFIAIGQGISRDKGSYIHFSTMIALLKSYIIETDNHIPKDSALDSISQQVLNVMNKVPKQYNLVDLRMCSEEIVLLSLKCGIYELVLALEYMEQRNKIIDGIWHYTPKNGEL